MLYDVPQLRLYAWLLVRPFAVLPLPLCDALRQLPYVGPLLVLCGALLLVLFGALQLQLYGVLLPALSHAQLLLPFAGLQLAFWRARLPLLDAAIALVSEQPTLSASDAASLRACAVFSLVGDAVFSAVEPVSFSVSSACHLVCDAHQCLIAQDPLILLTSR